MDTYNVGDWPRYPDPALRSYRAGSSTSIPWAVQSRSIQYPSRLRYYPRKGRSICHIAMRSSRDLISLSSFRLYPSKVRLTKCTTSFCLLKYSLFGLFDWLFCSFDCSFCLLPAFLLATECHRLFLSRRRVGDACWTGPYLGHDHASLSQFLGAKRGDKILLRNARLTRGHFEYVWTCTSVVSDIIRLANTHKYFILNPPPTTETIQMATASFLVPTKPISSLGYYCRHATKGRHWYQTVWYPYLNVMVVKTRQGKALQSKSCETYYTNTRSRPTSRRLTCHGSWAVCLSSCPHYP
jgi:hypothetical protein